MRNTPTILEKALCEYLKSGFLSEELEDAIEEGTDIHALVEIAIVPDYSKWSLDSLWINENRNSRLGVPLMPGENLTRFFRFINVHPRDVLTNRDFSLTPVAAERYLGNELRDSMNRQNAEVVTQMLSLLTNFKTDATRPALCSPEIARIIMDNASYGGFPAIAGWARISEILELDFSKPVTVNGLYQVGIYDNVNGSGHMESANTDSFEFNLESRDLIVCSTKGYTPNSIFDFVGKYYSLELSGKKASKAINEIGLVASA